MANATTSDEIDYLLWCFANNIETAAALTAVRHLGYEAGFTNGSTIKSICNEPQYDPGANLVTLDQL